MGSRNARALLTEEQVMQIVERIEAGWTSLAISEHFGVCRSTISHIRNGRQWKHVTHRTAGAYRRLTDQDVRDMRRMMDNGISTANVARQFGVTQPYAWKIKMGLKRRNA